MAEQTKEPEKIAPAPGAPGPDTGRPANQPASQPAHGSGPPGANPAAAQARPGHIGTQPGQEGPQKPAGPTDAGRKLTEQARPGAVPAADAARSVTLPPEHPHSGTIGPATTVVSGTEAARQQPGLQHVGGVGAAGDTQPGTPPAGEPERAVDPQMMDRLRETSPSSGHKPTAVMSNGGLTIRQRLSAAGAPGPVKQRALFINQAFVESVEDDGDTITVRTASGREIELDADESRAARAHLLSF